MRPGVTPVPIPNTMVKTRAADGTTLETMWESRWSPGSGDVAQLGEHLPCKQGVESSNLFVSTSVRGARARHSFMCGVCKSVGEAGLRTLEVNKEDEVRKYSSQGLVAQPVRAHA